MLEFCKVSDICTYGCKIPNLQMLLELWMMLQQKISELSCAD